MQLVDNDIKSQMARGKIIMKRAIVETATILGITAIIMTLIIVGEIDKGMNVGASMLVFSFLVLAVEKFFK